MPSWRGLDGPAAAVISAGVFAMRAVPRSAEELLVERSRASTSEMHPA
jgi:hypothetical protein